MHNTIVIHMCWPWCNIYMLTSLVLANQINEATLQLFEEVGLIIDRIEVGAYSLIFHRDDFAGLAQPRVRTLKALTLFHLEIFHIPSMLAISSSSTIKGEPCKFVPLVVKFPLPH